MQQQQQQMMMMMMAPKMKDVVVGFVSLVALCLASLNISMITDLHLFQANEDHRGDDYPPQPTSPKDGSADDGTALPRHRLQHQSGGGANKEAEFRHATTTTAAATGTDFAFGGCLMIMDDNHYLVEWLAYHWYVLPLRHLTVYVDPKSRTSPAPIFDRWKGRIAFDIVSQNWSYPHAYWQVPGKGRHGADPIQRKFVGTQLSFYGDCMRKYKEERNWNSWIVAIDTDEFILPMQERPGTRQQENAAPTLPSIDEAGSVMNAIKQLKRELPDPAPDCINVVRQQLCSRDEGSAASAESDYFAGFRRRDNFLTLSRYVLPQPLDAGYRGPKPMINVGGLQSDYFGNYSALEAHPHVLLRDRCAAGRKAKEPFRGHFTIYHYPGTGRQRNFRDDPRGNLKEKMGTGLPPDEACGEHGAPADQLVPWFQAFVDTVGLKEAHRLLEGAGHVDGWPAYESQ